jgi:hypothetical protein
MPTAEERETVQSTLPSEPQTVVVRREPERDLVSWKAVSRPFKKRDKQYFVTVFAVVGIVSLVVFLAEGLMPVVLIISLVFLYYIMSTVAPEEVEYKITNKGVKIADKLIEWQLFIRFWFGKRMDNDVLFFDTFNLPGRMEIVIKPELKETLKKEISAYLPYDEASATSLEKVTNWVAKKLPANN